MSPFTESMSPEGVPAPRPEPPPAEEACGNRTAFDAVNPFLGSWLDAIDSDGCLPTGASGVASVMARSVGIGRVAFTDWQRINTALGRHRRDLSVFEIMSELDLEGYLDRNVDDRFGPNYGWTLMIPEGEL